MMRMAKLLGCAWAALACAEAGALPRPDHVVVVVEENRAYDNIVGYANAPYINNTLIPQSALMTQSYGTDGASQPNYLNLFSGSDQGRVDNTITPVPFETPNLRSALAGAGFTFTGYSESLPSPGYTGASYTTVPGQNQYVRKHNPWINWIGAGANAVPAGEALPLTSFPADFASLPTVSFVIPNEQNNMHDGGRAAGDAWLQAHLGEYIDWAQTHNSLFVLTWDEDDGNHGNHIATLFAGAMVVPGQYGGTINHLNVLRTLEDMYGLPYLGNSAGASPITAAFAAASVPAPAPWCLWLAAGASWLRKTRRPALLPV